MTVFLLITTIIILILIAKSKKGGVSDFSNSTSNDDDKVSYTVSFPDPEKASDYRFFEFVQNKPYIILEALYKEMIKRGVKLKPDFDSAMKEKIDTGNFVNPINFKETYGYNFDYLGLGFTKGTTSPLSAFEISISFIKKDKLITTDNSSFCPPTKFLETKAFHKTLTTLELNLDSIPPYKFDQLWNNFDIKEYLNSNLVILWDKEEIILSRIFKDNKIADYNINYIKLYDIAIRYNIPTTIDGLSNFLDLTYSSENDLSETVSYIYCELKDRGYETKEFIQTLSQETKKTATKKVSLKVKESTLDFVAIDVETATSKRCSICQIGLVFVEKGEIKNTISKLVQPPNNEYLIRNIGIHGITAEMTQDKPSFDKIWTKIQPLIEGQKLIAHNASFDISCLRQSLDYYKIDIPTFDYECTFIASGLKLSDACRAYDIKLDNHHDALCDAEACALLHIALSNKVKPKEITITKVKQVSLYTEKGHERLQGDILKPDLENADKNSPFYNKKVVFTGVLELISRKEAAESVKKMGANINTSISKKTNFVIAGRNPGPSKMNKIIDLKNQDIDIEIIYEQEFLTMIKK